MVESLRVLKVCRNEADQELIWGVNSPTNAVQARRIALQITQTTILCAPDRLRDTQPKMTRMQLIRTLVP